MSYATPANLTELIDALAALREAHGDLPVYLNDPDTCWALPVHVNVQVSERGVKAVTVSSTYALPPNDSFPEID